VEAARTCGWRGVRGFRMRRMAEGVRACVVAAGVPRLRMRFILRECGSGVHNHTHAAYKRGSHDVWRDFDVRETDLTVTE